jgi:hypothetical protein
MINKELNKIEDLHDILYFRHLCEKDNNYADICIVEKNSSHNYTLQNKFYMCYNELMEKCNEWKLKLIKYKRKVYQSANEYTNHTYLTCINAENITEIYPHNYNTCCITVKRYSVGVNRLWIYTSINNFVKKHGHKLNFVQSSI